MKRSFRPLTGINFNLDVLDFIKSAASFRPLTGINFNELNRPEKVKE